MDRSCSIRFERAILPKSVPPLLAGIGDRTVLLILDVIRYTYSTDSNGTGKMCTADTIIPSHLRQLAAPSEATSNPEDTIAPVFLAVPHPFPPPHPRSFHLPCALQFKSSCHHMERSGVGVGVRVVDGTISLW